MSNGDVKSSSCDADNISGNIPEDYQLFECNICLDTAKDPVVSLCGHLFCWPCLHQWLEIRPNQQICPVCKAVINKDKVVPIYGRGCDNPEDPRKKKIPPRPSGIRSEPVNNRPFPHFTVGDNFHISFGIGTFPFDFFSSLFSYGTNYTVPTAFDVGTGSVDGANSNIFSRWIPRTDDEILQHFFLWLGVIFILWLILV